MTTKKLQLADKVFLIVHAEYHHLHEESDIMADKFGCDEEWTTITVDLEMHGKTSKNGMISRYVNDKHRKAARVPADVYMSVAFHDSKNLIQLRKENAEKLEALIAECRAEEMPEDAKEREAEKEAEKARAEKARAEKVIEECEKVIKSRGALMTEKEAEAYLRRLNDCLNEGGEGFLPKVWTQEEYDAAKRTLSA